MERKWTDAQQDAMRERSKTLLVSAAAGSGKTAVLTERIIRSLTDPEHPADISRILVVTFTKAAAGELRTRIQKALSGAIAQAQLQGKDTTYLSRQLMLLGGANISTIDSFYLDLVKRHFQEAGLPPAFRMADENELISLQRELMNDAVDEMYELAPGFHHISDTLCDIRHEGSLTDTLLEIAKRLDRYPEGIDILLRSVQKDPEAPLPDPLNEPVGRVWLKEVEQLALTGRRLFAKALDQMEGENEAPLFLLKYGPVYAELLERCRTLCEVLENGDYPTICKVLSAPFCQRVGRGGVPPCSAQFDALRELCEEFRALWKKEAPLLSVFTPEEISYSESFNSQMLLLLHEVLERFGVKYREAKLQRAVAEFSDVSRAAYHLLVGENGEPTPLARQIANDYDAIYIDEYQDVNAMQDATFRAISHPNNRFMVGDIKQSIYRFRGAQPEIFADYRRSFPDLADARESSSATVFMSDCFRCDKSVIDFSNTVSGYLFESSAESIGYKAEDALRFAKQPPSENYQSTPCRVVLIERKKGDAKASQEEKKSNAEARWIAAEIYRLLHSDERKTDGERIRPMDIAVLMRQSTLAAPLAKELSALGIPCNDTSRRSFFENSDVLCVYSLLCALDNPFRDVPLAAALRSPFFGFSLEDLVRVRTAADGSLSLYEALHEAQNAPLPDPLKKRLDGFFARFLTWREKAKTLPVDRLLRYLYRESAILSFAGRRDSSKNPGEERRANLQRLYEYARTFESGNFKGLYQFVRYMDDVMANGGKMPTPDGPADAVSLITVHHSKGLEYPVCFLASTATPFSKKDLDSPLLDDADLGCALRIPNAGAFSRANTFRRSAIGFAITKQALEEEMRILYVAMTRARERLYVTASPTHGTNALLRRAELAVTPEGKFLTDNGPSYIHWILTALLRVSYQDFAKLDIVKEDDIPDHEALHTMQQQQKRDWDADAVVDTLKERFSFAYPHKALSRLPAKLSVSRLSPGVLDVYDSESATPESIREEDAERLLHTFERAPLFGAQDPELLAAERGTATHEFLQFCDFERTAHLGIASELERLIEARYLAPNVRELVRVGELQRFFSSNFYRMLQSAKALHRETRFHIFLPAAEFTSDPHLASELQGERLAVQGVIDLFFESEAGELVLCDYKTDRLTREELADPSLAAAKLKARHGEQLSYYAKALEALCGRLPDRIFLYSLPLGEALEIKL